MQRMMRRMTSMEDVSVADKKHSVTDLLDDILAVCRQQDGRKELLEQIKALIRMKQNVILMATSDHWQKKYDQEQKEKSELVHKYQSLKQAFDLLSNKTLDLQKAVPSFDVLPREMPKKAGPRSRSFVTSTFKKSGFSAFKLSIEKEEKSEVGRRYDSEKKSELEDKKTCPLCQQQLHPVYAELGEKEQRVEILSDIIVRMTKKGRELMSVNSQLSSEIAHLKQEHQGMLEALKSLEQQIIRMMQEHSKVKRDFLDEVENKRKENEELRVRVSELESKIEHYHLDFYPGSPRMTANRRNSLPVKDGVEWHGKLANLQHLPTLEIDESEAHSHNEYPPSLLTPKKHAVHLVRGNQEIVQVKTKADRSALASSHNETNSTDPNDRRLLKPQKVPSEAGLRDPKNHLLSIPSDLKTDSVQPFAQNQASSSSKAARQSALKSADKTQGTPKNPREIKAKASPKARPSQPREDIEKKNLKVHSTNSYGCVLI
jgi:predicted  nucleic acid-binding Zn-ribbon protein